MDLCQRSSLLVFFFFSSLLLFSYLPKEMKVLKDKIAVVTGAANGIGRSLAVKLAKTGCKLALVDIDHPNLDNTQKLINRPFCSTHVIDLSQRDQIKGLAETVNQIYGGVDILINNAGVSIDAPFSEQTEEDIEWITRINYLGVVYSCKHFLPALLSRPEGHIVNVSGAAGIQGFPGKTTYCASKSAVSRFSEALRAELYEKHIGVSTIYPGPVRTSMLDRSRISNDKKRRQIQQYLQDKGVSPEAVAKSIIQAILKNKAKVFITRQSKTTSLLKRIFPSQFGEWIARNQQKLPA